MKPFLLLGLFAFLTSSHAQQTPYFGGVIPNYVKFCQEVERTQTAHLFTEQNKCNSFGFSSYKDNLSQVMQYDFVNNNYFVSDEVQSVHSLVTDTKVDRDPEILRLSEPCDFKHCFRVFIFINGDPENGILGTHIATWATSPGTPYWNDGSVGNYTPESKNVLNQKKQPNQNSRGHFKLQLDHEMGLGGVMTGKIDNHYVVDHYVNTNDENMAWAACYHFGICFHASGQVTGDPASHACTRLKYIEAKKMNFLARKAGRNFTVETRFTEVDTLTDEERTAVSQRERAVQTLNDASNLYDRVESGDEEAKREKAAKAAETGSGLY